MSKQCELTDESVHLVEKALWVEPLNYHLDLNQVPANGHEYIHQVKLERAGIFPQIDQDLETYCAEQPTPVTNNGEKMDLNDWKNIEANLFSRLAIQLEIKKEELKKKFQKRDFPPVKDKKKFCLYCLGSEMYEKVFKDENVEKVDEHLPFLSVVLHLSQEEILTAVQYMCDWSQIIGMNHTICRWMYALLACISKLGPDEWEVFLEEIYDTCMQRIKKCDESEVNQLHYIVSILKNYFCVKAYKVGPSLDKFIKLCT